MTTGPDVAYGVFISFKNGKEIVVYPSSRDLILSKEEVEEQVDKLMRSDTYVYIVLWDCYINPKEIMYAEIVEEGNTWSFPSQ